MSSTNHAKDLYIQSSSTGLQAQTQGFQTMNTNDTTVLAEALQRTYYQSAYLKSFYKDEQEQIVHDKDDLLREEMLAKLHSKWIRNDSDSRSRAQHASNIVTSAIQAMEPASIAYNTLSPISPSQSYLSEGSQEDQIISIQLSFLAAKWLPTFTSQWQLGAIRVQFCFFTEENISSHSLRFSGPLVPGTITNFQRPFNYTFHNENYDVRFTPYLSRPLYIQITDDSKQIVIASGLIDLPKIADPCIENERFYEVDLFAADNTSFLIGCIHIGCKTASGPASYIKTKPGFFNKDDKEESIVWTVEPGKTNILPLRIVNPYSECTKAYLSLQDASMLSYGRCRAELVTDREEQFFWGMKNLSEDLQVIHLNRDDEEQIYTMLEPNEVAAVLIKLHVDTISPVENDINNPQIIYKLKINFSGNRYPTYYPIIPRFLSPIVTRTKKVFVPETAEVPSTQIKLLKSSFQEMASRGFRTGSRLKPLVVLTNPNCFWIYEEINESIQLFWEPSKDKQEATCEVLLYKDPHHTEIIEAIKVNFQMVTSIKYIGNLSSNNQVRLPLDFKRGGVSKVRFMTSCPQMMNFDGKDELKKPYDHPYLPVRLFSIKPIKEDILIVGVDSSTNEVLQTWILSVRISFEEVLEENTKAQKQLSFFQDAIDLLTNLEFFADEYLLDLYRGEFPSLERLQTYSSQTFKFIQELCSTLNQTDLLPGHKIILTNLIPSFLGYHYILESLGNVHNLQQLIRHGMISTLYRRVLNVDFRKFLDHLVHVCLKHLLENTPRPSRFNKEGSNSIQNMPLIKAIKEMCGLLECFEKIMCNNDVQYDALALGDSEKIMITVDLITQRQVTGNPLEQKTIFEGLVDSIYQLSRSVIANTKRLTQDETNLNIQVGSLFDLIISSLSNVYVRVLTDANKKGTIKPLLTYKLYVEEETKEEKEVVDKAKGFIETAHQTLKQWSNNSIQKGSLIVDSGAVTELAQEVEGKIIEQSENLQAKWSVVVSGQYKDLERIYLELQHIKWLSKFNEMFKSPAHGQLLPLINRADEKANTMIHNRYSLLETNIAELAFNEVLFMKMAENRSGRQKDSCIAYERFFVVMRILTDFGKTINNIVQKYQMKIVVSDEFLEAVRELETYYIGRGREIEEHLTNIEIEYGKSYSELLKFFDNYYFKMCAGLGLDKLKLDEFREAVEEILRFKKLDGELEKIAAKVKADRKDANKVELIKIRAKLEGINTSIELSRGLVKSYFSNPEKNLKLFGTLEELPKIKDSLSSQRVENIRLYFVESLKEIEKLRK